MTTIFKYEFLIEDRFTIVMPEGARPLAVQMQAASPCLWAQINTENPPERVCFRLFGTGHEIPSGIGTDLRYIGTFQDGPFVGHLFVDHGV